MPTALPVPDLLVGRDVELAVLAAEFARATEHGCRAVLLTGDPGIGKTRLTVELIARQDADTLTLRARAYPLGSTSSLGLWVEALDGHLGQLTSDRRLELAGEYAGDLATLLPSLARGPVDPTPARLPLLRGLAHVLTGLAQRNPLIVVLDDVHLADGSSWEGLGYLVRALNRHPVLMVATARPLELAGHPLASEILLGLEQEQLARRVPIGPLDAAAVASLAASITGRQAVPEALVGWLMQRSRGAPLYASGLLRALIEEDADLSAPSLHALPEDLVERILLGLRRLDPAGRALLEMITVVGSRVGVGELVELCGQSLEAVATTLDDLVRQRLVTATEHGSTLSYETGHPLYADAVYAGLGAARRRALHRHIGRTLVAVGRAGAGAAHLIRSADPGDPEAFDALLAALRQAESRDLYRESLALLAGLVELLPAGDSRWLDVESAMTRLPEWLIDHRLDQGLEAALEATARIDALLGRVDSGPALAGVTRLAAGAASSATDPPSAREHLVAADVALLAANWPLLRARALALLGRLYAAAGRRTEAEESLRVAVTTFEQCGAVVRAGWAAEDLRRLGARGRRAAAASVGPAALSRREREVAGLACAGVPVRDIARDLFISERTVETHLSNVYAKLGVRSRSELAALAADLNP